MAAPAAEQLTAAQTDSWGRETLNLCASAPAVLGQPTPGKRFGRPHGKRSRPATRRGGALEDEKQALAVLEGVFEKEF